MEKKKCMKRRSEGRLPSKKYRYYFFDYIYFCGNLLQDKVPRTSGSLLIHSYWLFCLWGPIGIGARFKPGHRPGNLPDRYVPTAAIQSLSLPERPTGGYQAPLQAKPMDKNLPSPAGSTRKFHSSDSGNCSGKAAGGDIMQ